MKIIDGSITAPKGFLAQGVSAQIKKIDKRDLAIIYSPQPCISAGVFTTNLVRAHCVDLNKAHLLDGKAHAIVVNSGNANACTGEQGETDNLKIVNLTAQLLGINTNDVLVASTGVIGVAMPMEKVTEGIKQASKELSSGPEAAHNTALSIMTTDLYNKEIAVEIVIDGVPVRIGAIAKGSGMIHPNMATMLGFVCTDVQISHACLQQALKESTDQTYNMISVDRDTSTNDMLIAMANGLAGNQEINDTKSDAYKKFKDALDYVNTELAKKIARDGEGATRLIEIRVENAAAQSNARIIARAISASNLVKTAVFGEDANWGRILAAAGYSGAEFNPNKVDVYLGDEKMAENGKGLVFNEDRARSFLQQPVVLIRVDLKDGSYDATAWGCDLTYDYVKINASYRT